MLLSFPPISVLQDQVPRAMQPAAAGKRATASGSGKGPNPGGTAPEEGLLSWDCGQLAGQVAWLSRELSSRGYLCERLPSSQPAALATAQLAQPLVGLFRLQAGQVQPLSHPFERGVLQSACHSRTQGVACYAIRCTPGSEAKPSRVTA